MVQRVKGVGFVALAFGLVRLRGHLEWVTVRGLEIWSLQLAWHCYERELRHLRLGTRLQSCFRARDIEAQVSLWLGMG